MVMTTASTELSTLASVSFLGNFGYEDTEDDLCGAFLDGFDVRSKFSPQRL
jgi:hypothetical protein